MSDVLAEDFVMDLLQEQRRAGEEEQAAQAPHPVGGGEVQEREGQDGAGEGVQETFDCQEEEGE